MHGFGRRLVFWKVHSALDVVFGQELRLATETFDLKLKERRATDVPPTGSIYVDEWIMLGRMAYHSIELEEIG